MLFRKQNIEIGDLVALRSNAVPLPEVQAAVININSDEIEVLSTMLIPFKHNGKFKKGEVDEIVMIHPADYAIPQESRGKFQKEQTVTVTVKGRKETGSVIAAFDGIIVAQRKKDGKFIVGGMSYFN